MSVDISAAVLMYEESRQKIKSLTEERGEMLSNCKSPTFENGFSTCGMLAYEASRDCEEPNWTLSRAEYESFFLHDINEFKGACDSCRKAYDIKKGPLAKAKKEFGIAKRHISRIGKRIMERQQ